jgi:septal ring factor EnvC (AmiA/AmiB activator)
VTAAAEGRVVFADLRMEGYGKTVILEHPGGFWTVYAHLADISVLKGEKIRQGRPLGRLDDRNKRLYFEFRRGDRAEDPAQSWK